TAGEFLDPLCGLGVGFERFVCPVFDGEVELVLTDVERDHSGRSELAQELQSDVPETTGPDDDGGRSTHQSRKDVLDGLVRRQGRVSEGRSAYRVEVVDRDHVAR